MKTNIITALLLLIFTPIFTQTKTQNTIDDLNESAVQKIHSAPVDAFLKAEQALNSSTASKYLEGKAISANTLGTLYRDQCRYFKAEEAFKTSLETYQKLGDLDGQAKVYNNLATLKNLTEDFEEAILLCHRAIEIWEKLDNHKGLGIVYNNLANIYDAMPGNQRKKARTYYKLSKRLAEEEKDSITVGKNLYNLANWHYKRLHFDTASVYLNQTLNWYQKFSDRKGLGMALSLFGLVESGQNKFSQAQMFFDSSLQVSKVVNDSSTTFYTYSYLGLLKEKEERYEESIAYYRAAEKYVPKAEHKKHQIYLNKLFSDAFWYANQLDSAYLYMEDAYHIQEERNEEWKLQQKGIWKSEAAFITNLYDEKLAVEKEKSAWYLTLSGLLIIVFLSVLIALVQRQEKLKADKNTVQARLDGELLERKRIAEYLHDGVGSMLVACRWFFENMDKEFAQQKLKKAKIKEGQHLIDDTYSELRKVVRELEVDPVGWLHDLEKYCWTIAQTEKLDIDFLGFGVEKIPAWFNEEIGPYIKMMVEELIANVRHADAKKVTAQINYLEDTVSIMVEDDGKGFSLAKLERSRGLRHIRERVNRLGGQFKIDSGNGVGTTAMISIPLQNTV